MALKSGFFNAIETDGVYDRVYSADEYTNFYSAFLRDGVRRSGNDDFKCTASGLIITVAAGFAICGSKWVNNETATTLAAVVPPVGEYSRIDRVFLHVDTNEATRAASIVYRTGTPAANPQPPAKNTDTGIFELCLCNVTVAPAATSLVLNDTRGNSSLCGWVTTPVGYDDFFTSLDSAFNQYMENAQGEFNSWFDEVRETLAVATLFKQYTWFVETTATTTTSVTFNIPQYDPTGVDIVQVYTNGMLEIAGVDYAISGSTVTFTNPKIAGSQILVVVYKSIDGEGLGSVSDEVTALQNEVDAMADAYEYNYICNGETDNEGLYDLIYGKQSSIAENGYIKVNIYGTFGATHARGWFSDTQSGIFMWFGANWGNRKIILDFANCSPISINGEDYTELPDGTEIPAVRYFVVDVNSNIEFHNLNLITNNIASFSTAPTKLTMVNCRVTMNFDSDYWNDACAVFAYNGCFYRCLIKVVNGCCFDTSLSTKILKVVDCECYAYSIVGESGTIAGIVLHVNSNYIVPVQMERVNCPVVALTGYEQRICILDEITTVAHAVYSNIVSTLPITATNQNVSGKLNISLPYM